MYKYTCSIDVCEPTSGVYKPYVGIVVKSEVPLSRRDLRNQVINKVPEKYTGFGAMYIQSEEQGEVLDET